MKKIKKLFIWIYEGKYLLLIIFLLIGVSFVQYIDIGLNSISKIKIYGLILQLIGALTIINSLRNRLLLFKGHGLIHLLLSWLNKFPFFRRGTVNEAKVNLMNSPSSFSAGIKKVIKSPDKNNPEDIVRYIDEKIEEIKERGSQIDNKLTSEINEIKNKLDLTSKSVSDNVNVINRKIEDSALSNVWSEFFGVACIIMGLFFSTIPELIIKLVP